MESKDLIEIKPQRVDALYRQSIATISASVTAALILIIVLWGEVAASRLMSWFLILLLITCIRIFYVYKYKSLGQEQKDYDYWLRVYLIGAIAFGIMWGLIIYIFMLNENIIYMGFMLLCICGLVAGSVASYSVFHSVFYGLNLPAVIPIIIYLFSHDEPQLNTLGILFCFFVGFLFVIEYQGHKMINNSLMLQVSNLSLVRYIDDEQEKINSLTITNKNSLETTDRTRQKLIHAQEKIKELEKQLELYKKQDL